jgi:hypothetical protein
MMQTALLQEAAGRNVLCAWGFMRKGTSRFDPRIADRICMKLAEGQSLIRACAEPGMPSVQTIYVWCRTNEALKEKLERAKQAAALG